MAIKGAELARARDIIETMRSNLSRFPKIKDVYLNKDHDFVVFETNLGGGLALPINTFLSMYHEETT